MKKNYDSILKILLCVLILGFNLIIVCLCKDSLIIKVCIIFSILILLVFFIYDKVNKRNTTKVLEELSDMLDSIIKLKDNEVFSTMEDTILSKLQVQSIKLSKIFKAQNKRLKDERDEIKKLISDIAHQLKTPLTNVKMYSEFLLDNNLSEDERKEFTEVILVSLNKLSFLVESMIKMSRLESGVINLKKENQSITETVLLAISQVQKKAKMKHINIDLKELDKRQLVHDKNWTVEALFNILENGIKYTGEYGEIVIILKSYEMFFRIDIKDNGIGIVEEEIPKIFSRFYRGKNVGDSEGIGIGLYLTRDIIEKQDGYIKVSSNKEGSCFSVFLPL